MYIGLEVAMMEEAQPIIDGLKLTKCNEGVYCGALDNSEIILMLSGIGKVNAQNTAWKLISLGVDRIINIGTCGDLANKGIGAVVLPNIFYDGDFNLEMLGNMTKDPANVNGRYILTADSKKPANPEICYTYSTFVTDKRAEGAIVDMEAYAIASACERVGIKFIAVKCTSDGADEDASESFDNNVTSVVGKHLPLIENIIKDFDDAYNKIYKLED